MMLLPKDATIVQMVLLRAPGDLAHWLSPPLPSSIAARDRLSGERPARQCGPANVVCAFTISLRSPHPRMGWAAHSRQFAEGPWRSPEGYWPRLLAPAPLGDESAIHRKAAAHARCALNLYCDQERGSLLVEIGLNRTPTRDPRHFQGQSIPSPNCPTPPAASPAAFGLIVVPESLWLRQAREYCPPPHPDSAILAVLKSP
jgi:hypothetical protein